MRQANPPAILLALLLLGAPFAYTAYGGAFYCANCSDCSDALNDGTYDTVYLNSSADFDEYSWACIDWYALSGMTFDCQGHYLNGGGTEDYYGIVMDGPSNNNVIRNCNITGFLYGLTLWYGEGNVITNNTFEENAYEDIDTTGGTADDACNNLVENNTGSGGLPIYHTNESVNWGNFSASQVILCGADGSNLTNVTVSGSSTLHNNGIYLMYSHNVSVSNSNSSGNEYGLFVYNAGGEILANNSLWENGGDLRMDAGYESECNNLVEDNTGTGGFPIYYSNETANLSDTEVSLAILCNADNSVFTNVTAVGSNVSGVGGTAFDASFSGGFQLLSSSSQSGATALSTYHSDYAVVANNTFVGGISLISTMNASIENNTFSISDSSYYGVNMFTASNNTYAHNTFTGNPSYYLIRNYYYSGRGNGNLFYDNIFNQTGSGTVIYDNGANYWNTTKDCSTPNIFGGRCTGGNWYSNYTGSDDNADGIGETSYIAPNVIDYLPLVASNGIGHCSGTCADCVSALNNNTYHTVYLTSDLSSPGASCIDNPANFTNKTFDCQGNTLSGDGTSSGIYLSGKSNVTIKNCEISGFYRGLYVGSLQLSHFDNLTILDSEHDSVAWSNVGNSTLSNSTITSSAHEGMSLDDSSDNLIINNTFSYARQQAIELMGALNNTIIYNTLHSAEQGIDAHGTSDVYRYNLIANNTIYNVSSGISFSGYFEYNTIVNNTIGYLYNGTIGHGSYIDIWGVLDTSMCNNTIENNTGEGKPIYYYHDYSANISNLDIAELFLCNMDNTNVQNVTMTGGGLSSRFSDNLTVNSSYSYYAPYGFNILYGDLALSNSVSQESKYRDLKLSPYIEASGWSLNPAGTTITNLTGSGGRPINYTSSPVNWSNEEFSQVIMYFANGSILDNVVISGSDTRDNNGLEAQYSHDMIISNSDSSDNRFGFYIVVCDNLTLSNNTISGNGEYGFRSTTSDDLLLENNTANNNGIHGIYFSYGASPTIRDNTACGNGYSGINVEYGVTEAIIDSNTACSNGLCGIAAYSVFNATIANNLVYSNGDPDSGILAFDAPQFLGSWTVRAHAGIRIGRISSHSPPYSQDVTLANNTVYGNTYYGILANYSDNITSTNDRVYGNALADVYAGTDGTAREVYFAGLLLDSSDYPNLSITDPLEANTIYTIKTVPSPNTNYPGSLTSVQNRVINITNITGSPTIDTLTIAWGTLEESRYNESTFDLWRYLTSWVDLNATANTTSNTVNYSSVVTQGAYGILGIYTYVEDEEGNDDECGSDSDCGECGECVGGTCELPAGACLNDGDCTGEGETCESCSCIPPECVNDGDCGGEGETCINYECVPPECTDDADCPTGYACENYECTAPECAEDADCASMGEGYTCTNYVCTPPECVVNEDCPACYECTDYACALPQDACTSSAECPVDYTCEACECIPPAYECTYDEDCPGEGYICYENECYPPECLVNEDCDECYECSSYECELPAGSCGINSDCLIEGAGYSCEDCSCIPPECTDSSECSGEGEVCENYVCVPPNCVDDGDCPSGYTCSNYECVAPECFYNDDCGENQICKDYACMDRKEERPSSGSPKPIEEEEPEEVEVGGEDEGGERGGAGAPSFVSEILDSISEIMLVTVSPDEGAGEGGEVQVEQTSLSATGWAFTLGAGALILYLLLRKFLPRPKRRG